MIRRWQSEEEGSSAAEFALVLPLFIVLTMGVVHLGLMMFATANLHATAEEAARCWALTDTSCTTKAATETYAAGIYKGATSPPTFVATDETASGSLCGWKVHADATYKIQAGFITQSIPISADACFPDLDS